MSLFLPVIQMCETYRTLSTDEWRNSSLHLSWQSELHQASRIKTDQHCLGVGKRDAW